MSLDKNSTPRLRELIKTQVEVQTEYRRLTVGEPERLEAILKEETNKYLQLKQFMDDFTKDKTSIKKNLLKDKRAFKFYQEKINEIRIDKFESRFQELKNEIRQIEGKREELKRLNKALEEFDGLEPTNEALKQKIDDLKKCRLSLEMTFVDEQSSP